MNKKTFSIFNFKPKRGFTLVEMIVSMAIFSIVAVVALGAMAKIISANRKAQALQSSITNLNYALDSMSREISSGVNFNCGTGTFSLGSIRDPLNKVSPLACSGGLLNNEESYIAFNNVSKPDEFTDTTPCHHIYAYIFSEKPNGFYGIDKAKQSDCDDTSPEPSAIVDENVTITDYYISLENAGANQYPLVTIRVSGYAGVREKERSYFNLQTAVSARQI